MTTVISASTGAVRTIRVLIVDDSAVIRKVLSEALGAAPGIEVMATASDPIFARQKLRPEDWPDVIVLDVEMPRMDGITFLTQLMAERPTPVVICSTLTTKGAETTMQALAAGAVSFVTKPVLGARSQLAEACNELISQVRVAAQVRVRAPRTPTRPLAGAVGKPVLAGALAQTTDRVVAIGTSTGGTVALERVLSALPRVCPPIVIVQHMPENFTTAFAARLDRLCPMEVKEAANGDRATPGRVLIAPGGKHMRLARSGAQYFVEVVDGPLVNRHRPSVDVLFRSVAQVAGKSAAGFILTGMGDDGARGLKEMRDAGARTHAQDEASCVVYGMPKEAVKIGAAEVSLPLVDVARRILALAN